MLALHIALMSIALTMGCASHPDGRSSSTVTASSVGSHASLGQDFELRIGETVEIDGEPLVVTFERVVEDSRCPTNVTCVWAGDAVVRIRLQGAKAEAGTLDLHTQSDANREGGFERYRVRLVQLLPAPQDSGGIPPERYVATLIVVRTE